MMDVGGTAAASRLALGAAVVLVAGVVAPWGLARGDGGTQWVVTSTFERGGAIAGVAFEDPLRGWAIGAGGMLQGTVDGGAHWHRAPSGSADDLQRVRITGSMRLAAGGATVLRSLDGLTWTRLPYTTLPVGVLDVAAAGDHTLVVAVAAGANQGLYRSVDGGTIWQRTLAPPAGHSIGAVAFPAPDNGWACGDTGLYRSRDGGTHWVPIPVPIDRCDALDFSSVGMGVAGGTVEAGGRHWSAVILHTADGGDHWIPGSVHTAASEDAVRVHAAAVSADGRQELAAVGSSLYLSEDGGTGWVRQSLPAGLSTTLTAVGFRQDTPYAVAGAAFLQWGSLPAPAVPVPDMVVQGTPQAGAGSGSAPVPFADHGSPVPLSSIPAGEERLRPFPTATQSGWRLFQAATPPTGRPSDSSPGAAS